MCFACTIIATDFCVGQRLRAAACRVITMLQILFDLIKHLMEVLGIKWAPIDIPMARRIQTLAAAAWISTMLMGEFMGIGLLLFIMNRTNYYYLALAYIYWIAVNRDACDVGGRTKTWVRNLSWWSYFRDYFPLKLVKTADLDPERNYLFCVFPHGVLCTGAFASFATEANGFSKLFPGMTSHLLTLGGHFLVPFFREFIYSLGACSASSESMTFLLDSKKSRGRCAVLVVGGAAESLNCQPGEYKVILSKRKGFVKVAMKTGAPLVPVFSFGETDLYKQFDNPEGSLLRTLQEKFRQVTGIAPVIPLGRGLLQYTIGVLPMRKPVTTVVGKPQEVKRNLDPTDEEVDLVHKEFVERLRNLFESEKHKYLQNANKTHLDII